MNYELEVRNMKTIVSIMLCTQHPPTYKLEVLLGQHL